MLKKCRNRDCGNLFSTNKTEILFCPRCDEEHGLTEDQAYQIIRNYLIDEPNATVQELKENTEVSLDMITTLYQSGRFTLVNVPHCNRCGGILLDPKQTAVSFCKPCSESLSREIGQSPKATQAPNPQAPTKINRNYGIGSR